MASSLSASWATCSSMDLSFISLTKILKPLWQLLVPPREIILLVKPQFEVGREKVGKKGVVRDPAAHAQAIEQVLLAAQAQGWQYQGLTWSPLRGPAGNLEYLLWLSTNDSPEEVNLDLIMSVCQKAGQQN